MPIESKKGLIDLPISEKYTVVGDWPGSDIVRIGCDFNRGRSVIGRVCFMGAFTEIKDVRSFAISPNYNDILSGRFLDPDVFKVLKEHGYPTDDEQTFLDTIDPKADYIFFTNRFRHPESSRQTRLLRQVIDVANRVICIPVVDPSHPNDALERSEAILQCFKEIESLMFTRLKGISIGIDNGDVRKSDNGVYYPFGELHKDISTFRYMKGNWGWSGDIG